MATKAALLKDATKGLEIRTKRAVAINKEYDAANKASERAKVRIEAASAAKQRNDTEIKEFTEIVTALGGEVPETVSETTDETVAGGEVSETTDETNGEVSESPEVIASTEGDEAPADETPRAKGGRFTRKG